MGTSVALRADALQAFLKSIWGQWRFRCSYVVESNDEKHSLSLTGHTSTHKMDDTDCPAKTELSGLSAG